MMSPQKASLPSLSRQSTSEIFTTTDYGLTQLWASAFRLAGCGGIRYRARHDLAHIAACLALFGPADVSKSPAGFEVVDPTICQTARISSINSTAKPDLPY